MLAEPDLCSNLRLHHLLVIMLGLLLDFSVPQFSPLKYVPSNDHMEGRNIEGGHGKQRASAEQDSHFCGSLLETNIQKTWLRISTVLKGAQNNYAQPLLTELCADLEVTVVWSDLR